jgi:hypothetical protein
MLQTRAAPLARNFVSSCQLSAVTIAACQPAVAARSEVRRSLRPPIRPEIQAICDAVETFPNISPNIDPPLARLGALSARQASTPTPHLREGLQGDPASKMAIAASPRRLHARHFCGPKITPVSKFFKQHQIIRPVSRVSALRRSLADASAVHAHAPQKEP